MSISFRFKPVSVTWHRIDTARLWIPLLSMETTGSAGTAGVELAMNTAGRISVEFANEE
jgi:hypothetical protein